MNGQTSEPVPPHADAAPAPTTPNAPFCTKFQTVRVPHDRPERRPQAPASPPRQSGKSFHRGMAASEVLESADEDDDARPDAERCAAIRELRTAVAEAARRIDRLMVIRRRQLAAVRSRRASN
jgi:hypothetical protein